MKLSFNEDSDLKPVPSVSGKNHEYIVASDVEEPGRGSQLRNVYNPSENNNNMEIASIFDDLSQYEKHSPKRDFGFGTGVGHGSKTNSHQHLSEWEKYYSKLFGN